MVTAIGIVVGVVNSTGLGFRLGFMVTNSALTMAEGLYGMISGSPTSDVVTTGSITIPVMKRSGFTDGSNQSDCPSRPQIQFPSRCPIPISSGRSMRRSSR